MVKLGKIYDLSWFSCNLFWPVVNVKVRYMWQHQRSLGNGRLTETWKYRQVLSNSGSNHPQALQLAKCADNTPLNQWNQWKGTQRQAHIGRLPKSLGPEHFWVCWFHNHGPVTGIVVLEKQINNKYWTSLTQDLLRFIVLKVKLDGLARFAIWGIFCELHWQMESSRSRDARARNDSLHLFPCTVNFTESGGWCSPF